MNRLPAHFIAQSDSQFATAPTRHAHNASLPSECEARYLFLIDPSIYPRHPPFCKRSQIQSNMRPVAHHCVTRFTQRETHIYNPNCITLPPHKFCRGVKRAKPLQEGFANAKSFDSHRKIWQTEWNETASTKNDGSAAAIARGRAGLVPVKKFDARETRS